MKTLITHKFNCFAASILKDSNRLVCCSQHNPGAVPSGAYLKITNESNLLYSVINSKKFFYLKDFEVVNGRFLKIKDNTGVNLQKEDLIKIIYNEYKFSFLLNIINKGKFYQEGEILVVKGGELSIDISNGIGYPTKFKVEQLDAFGGIDRLSCESEGKYIVPPSGKIEVFSENGTDLLLELEYKQIENRNIQERVIKDMEFKNNETFITLDYSLPKGIKNGNLSVEKIEIFLMEMYHENTLYNQLCFIFRDFTPNLQLPLISKNSTTFDMLVNRAFFILDNKCLKLENEIEMIKRKIR